MSTDTGYKLSFTNQIFLSKNNSQIEVMGTNSAISPLTLSPTNVMGANISFGTIALAAPVIYGGNASVTGNFPTYLISNVNGEGNILYYGDVAEINSDNLTLSGQFSKLTAFSGLLFGNDSIDNITATPGNSFYHISATGSILFPEASTPNQYVLISNYAGSAFSASGVSNFITSVGTSQEISLSGVGSHVGLISNGTSWIAIEESGVV